MKCHYLGWIRSFLDTGFLVHSYSESGTLYPDSSFVKVRFSLCRLYFLCRQGAIGGEKRECFVLHRIIGQTDHKSKYNVAIIIKSSSIEYILFKKTDLRIFIDFWKRENWPVSSCMAPDWGLNLQPFGVWDDAPTEPPGQSQKNYFLNSKFRNHLSKKVI